MYPTRRGLAKRLQESQIKTLRRVHHLITAKDWRFEEHAVPAYSTIFGGSV